MQFLVLRDSIIVSNYVQYYYFKVQRNPITGKVHLRYHLRYSETPATMQGSSKLKSGRIKKVPDYRGFCHKKMTVMMR